METITNNRPPRSLFRRLMWPIGMAVAVLGASGGGAYWCLNGTTLAQTDNPLRAHSAKDELKNLFAVEAAEETKLSPAAKQLFEGPATEPKTESKSTVVSTDKPKVLGDRYGNYAPQVQLPPLEESTKNTRSAAEVTRGQDPDVNPLRAADDQVQQAIAAEEVNSIRQAANAETISTAIPAADYAPTRAALISEKPADALASALANARPLQPAPTSQTTTTPTPQMAPPAGNPFAAVNNRYTQSQPTSAQPTIAQPTPSLPPVVDLGAADAALAKREPTPAVPLEHPQVPTLAEPQFAADNSEDTGITPTPGLASQPGSGRPGERLLEGSQTPSLTILKLAPPEIQVGKRCTFGIRVQNTGQRTAQNVQIHDEIPLGTELVGTSPRASVSGGKVVWDLGTLSVGEERTVEMELIPTDEGEIGSVATVMMAAQASAKARCTKPELAMRLSSQPQVHTGQQHIVQVEITNPGSGSATGVMLLETVPAGVSHEAGPALEFEIGDLAPGETRRLELVLTAEQAGRVTNTMMAKAEAGLHVEASCEFEVIAPDLKVTVDGPERRFLERPATYQVSIDNPGSAPAKEVQLVTHLPKGLQFVSANNLGEYDAAAHSVFWSLAELPANERGTVELVALPVEPGQHTLQFTTKARDGLTDQVQKEVTVEGIAALMFEVVDMDDPIEVGGETSYEIRVVNQGSKAAGNVQVMAIMPPGLRALSGNGDTRHAVQGDRVIFAPIPQLGPKAETTFRIQAQGVRDGDHRLKVQITTDEIREPITKEESTRVYSDH
jgi:uncharacterized repeat protein (TIGR01451 family)